jgi:hypothetical protein
MLSFDYLPGLLLLLVIPLILFFAQRRSLPRPRILTAFFLLEQLHRPAPTRTLRFFRLKKKTRQSLVALVIASLSLAISGTSLVYRRSIPEKWLVVVDNLPLGLKEFEGTSVHGALKEFIAQAAADFGKDDMVTILTTSPRPSARTFARGRDLEKHIDTLSVAGEFLPVPEIAGVVDDLAGHCTLTVVLSPRSEAWRRRAPSMRNADKIIIPPTRAAASGNAGITNLGIRAGERSGRYDLFLEASASDVSLERLGLAARNNGKPLPLPADVPLEGGRGRIYIEDVHLAPGEVTFDLDSKDAFPMDNTFSLSIKRPEPVRVSLAGASKSVFAAALESYEFFDTVEETAEADVGIFLGELPQALEGPALLIYPSVDRFDISLAELVEATDEILWHPDHQITAALPPGSFRPHRIMRLLFDESLESVGSVAGIPVILAGRRNGERIVVWSFNPFADDFFLTPEFVILLRECVAWLAGTDVGRKGLAPGAALTREARAIALPDTESDLFQRREPQNRSLDLVQLFVIIALLAALYLGLSDSLSEEDSR